MSATVRPHIARRWWVTRLACAAWLGLPTAHMAAQSLEDAKTAYAEGRFLEAAEIASALGTAQGYTVAAKSLAIHIHFEASEEEWAERAQQAIEMGESATRADSTSAQAHLQAARVLGRYAQGIGWTKNLREGIPERIRALLDRAIQLDPYLADARMALGGWHADIAAAGFVARQMYGGNREAAIVLFEQALELAPDSRSVLYEYGKRLPDLDESTGEQRAREMLDKAAQLPVTDAFDGIIQGLVLEELAKLNEN